MRRHLKTWHPEEWEKKIERSKLTPNIRRKSRIIDPDVNGKAYYMNMYACEFCDAFFGSRSGLTHHLKKWHTEKLSEGIQYKFKYAPCEQKFDTVMELENHQKTAHPEYWKEKQKFI